LIAQTDKFCGGGSSREKKYEGECAEYTQAGPAAARKQTGLHFGIIVDL
jgi:hypothetical protein